MYMWITHYQTCCKIQNVDIVYLFINHDIVYLFINHDICIPLYKPWHNFPMQFGFCIRGIMENIAQILTNVFLKTPIIRHLSTKHTFFLLLSLLLELLFLLQLPKSRLNLNRRPLLVPSLQDSPVSLLQHDGRLLLALQLLRLRHNLFNSGGDVALLSFTVGSLDHDGCLENFLFGRFPIGIHWHCC